MALVSDAEILAITLWGEGRGEPVESRIAIANVIRNRQALGRWGATITDVCRAPMQFSCWNAGADKNHLAVMALLARIVQGAPIVDPVYRENLWIASGLQSGAMRDNVDGATYYHADTENPRPKWAIGEIPLAHVGRHLYYKGIA